MKAGSAIMKSAHRTYFAMNWKGPTTEWDFARCLRLAHAEIRGKRDMYMFTRIEEVMQRLVKETAGELPTDAQPHLTKAQQQERSAMANLEGNTVSGRRAD
jgi:hypothetical protein